MRCNFIHWVCTRVQYDYILHSHCFFLINMLENGMSRVLLLANRKTVKKEPYVIIYNYCTWTRSIWRLVQYCSSVVIVLIHIKALFYSNLEILWKLKFFKLFENFITLNFFEILWNFWKFWNFMKILNLKKKMKF